MKYLSIVVLLLSVTFSYGQTSTELVGAAGQSNSNADIILDWSVGEVAIQSYGTPELRITEGFHQPRYSVISLNDEIEPSYLEIYPNPATEVLIISNKSNYELIKSEIYNNTGQLLSSYRENRIDLSTLLSGHYIIRAYLDNGETISYKIIKL